MHEDKQRVVIITGAGSGVGRALAVQLGSAGYGCVLAGRSRASLEATEQMLPPTTHANRILVVPTDVGDSSAVNAMVNATLEKFGRIDALANVAGVAPLQALEDIDDATLAQCFATNFNSIVYTTRACWSIFKKQQHGIIVNISSMASIDPFTGFNIYGAAKAAVNLFTKATADEGSVLGIKAYAIAPGAIETQMLRAMFDETMLPKDKTLSAEQVAQAIADCIEGDTTMQSGETLVLDSP